MKAEPFNPSATTTQEDRVARALTQLAWLMDRAITIPGTKVSVGLDALLGLLPVGGDVLTGFVQTALVLVALKHYRVPKTVAARMFANVLVDIAVGAVPLMGDLFDVAFKANTRNIKLLEPYTPQGRPGSWDHPIPASSEAVHVTPQERGTSWRTIVPIAVGLFLALGLMLVGFVTVVRWAIHHL